LDAEELFKACFFLPIILAAMPHRNNEILFWQTFLAVTWAVFLAAVLPLFWPNAFRRFTRYEGTPLNPPIHLSESRFLQEE
jgi:hypothetical protein